jgi:arylformamidase
MLIDITRTIGLDTLTYPGDDPPLLERTDSIARGDDWNGTHLQISVHCGTHLDAPLHFIPDGMGIAEIPPARFILTAHVIDCGEAQVIGPGLLDGVELRHGDGVLFKTTNALLPRTSYSDGFVALNVEAAQRLVELKAGLAGVDYLSIEAPGDPQYTVHKTLLGAGMLILEDVDLRNAEPGAYRLYCFPLKLRSTEASPVRAVLETM